MVKLPDRAIDSHHRQQGKKEHSQAVSLPKKARLISTPLASELSNRITTKYSTIIQFFDPSFNSQQSTVNNNSGASGIDINCLTITKKKDTAWLCPYPYLVGTRLCRVPTRTADIPIRILAV
jgi:hypothetical protein